MTFFRRLPKGFQVPLVTTTQRHCRFFRDFFWSGRFHDERNTSLHRERPGWSPLSFRFRLCKVGPWRISRASFVDSFLELPERPPCRCEAFLGLPHFLKSKKMGSDFGLRSVAPSVRNGSGKGPLREQLPREQPGITRSFFELWILAYFHWNAKKQHRIDAKHFHWRIFHGP